MNYWHAQQHGWNSNTFILNKKARLKRCMLYDSVYMTFQKRPNYGTGDRLSVAGGWGEKRRDQWQKGRRKFLHMREQCYILVMAVVTRLRVCRSSYSKGGILLYANDSSINLTFKKNHGKVNMSLLPCLDCDSSCKSKLYFHGNSNCFLVRWSHIKLIKALNWIWLNFEIKFSLHIYHNCD